MTHMRTMRNDVDAMTMEKELLISTNNGLRDAIQETGSDDTQRPDGTYMSEDEFALFQETVKRKLYMYHASKEEILRMQDEMVELKRSEEELKAQHSNLKDRFLQEEKRLGVTGFRDASERLEETGKQTASLNDLKTQTLDEISAMAEKIAARRPELEPKVRE